MAFNFPINPAVNQVYTSGPATYIWNGQGWANKSAPGAVVAQDQNNQVLFDHENRIRTLDGKPKMTFDAFMQNTRK